MDSVDERRAHIVMLPLMAQGHIIPFLELAKMLGLRGGFRISLVTTPRNLLRLQPAVSSAREAHGVDIRLEEMEFPKGVEGLPADAENTDALPYHLMFLLVRTCELLHRPLETLLRRLSEEGECPPTCVISDMFFGWSLDVCKRVGIPRVTFMTMGAFPTLLYYSLWTHLPHRRTLSHTFSLAPDLPTVSLQKSQLPLSLKQADESDPWCLFVKRQIDRNLQSWGTLLNTFDDLERTFVDDMRAKSCGRVWSVGPVLPHASKEITTRGCYSNEAVEAVCMEWLDSRPPSSVLYISFGTQVRITRHQMQELALGLEASGKPFVWAVRPPVEVTDSSWKFLPEGFEQRMGECGQGLVLKGWAPQLMILSHSSTGGFLSHCGWNSILESLSEGVPIMGWPIAAEQFYNSKLLEEEVGVSVEICRGVEGEVERDDVARTVNMFMEEEKGIALRKKAVAMRDAAKKAVSVWWSSDPGREMKGSSIAAIDDFIREVNTLRLKTEEPPLAST